MEEIKLKVGYISCGWILVKEYERFNLWKRINTGVRECFYKDQIPDEDSNPILISDFYKNRRG